MNNETKIYLKQVALFLLCATIGGFIGGMLSNCCNYYRFEKHAHKHFQGPNMEFNNFDHKRHHFKHEFHPNNEGVFIEEDYIIIPKKNMKNINDNIKKPEFDKEKYKNKRKY